MRSIIWAYRNKRTAIYMWWEAAHIYATGSELVGVIEMRLIYGAVRPALEGEYRTPKLLQGPRWEKMLPTAIWLCGTALCNVLDCTRLCWMALWLRWMALWHFYDALACWMTPWLHWRALWLAGWHACRNYGNLSEMQSLRQRWKFNSFEIVATALETCMFCTWHRVSQRKRKTRELTSL